MKKIYSISLILGAFTLLAATIDLNNLIDYAYKSKPTYITKDNSPVANPINNKGVLLGRVLFYDKQLSINNTIACASCHQQQFAFGDTATLSVGFNKELTGRHSMRLVNARFGTERKFFWDERAISLEAQTTQPLQNHIEMGFSNTNGDPGLDSLLRKMKSINYYPQLFQFVYGSDEITETKMQNALAQFVRSIQSFDSKYDIGRAQVNADNINFPNFTAEENQGKALFLSAPANGGAGCQGCHTAPEFDIAPNTLNNGIIADALDSTKIDLTNTRAPSLRNIVNANGVPNGPMMHNGKVKSLLQVINHYNSIPAITANTNLDPKLRGPGGNGINLNLTEAQKNALVAFLRTLSGNDIYTNERWSNPFDAVGKLTIIPVTTTGITSLMESTNLRMYPNPASQLIQFELPQGTYQIAIYGINGQLIQTNALNDDLKEDITALANGIYFVQIMNQNKQTILKKKLYKVSE